METGKKIVPGIAHPLPWKPKNGMCTEIPSPAGNMCGFIPNKRLGGFVPAVLLFQYLSFGCWCLTGGVVPLWSLVHLQHVWILDIQSLEFFLHGIVGSAPKCRIFWVPRKPEEPLGQSLWGRAVSVSVPERSRLCHPSTGNGNGALGALRLHLQQELGMPPSGAVLLCPLGFGTRSLQDVPADFNPSSLPVLLPDEVFRPL